MLQTSTEIIYIQWYNDSSKWFYHHSFYVNREENVAQSSPFGSVFVIIINYFCNATILRGIHRKRKTETKSIIDKQVQNICLTLLLAGKKILISLATAAASRDLKILRNHRRMIWEK